MRTVMSQASREATFLSRKDKRALLPWQLKKLEELEEIWRQATYRVLRIKSAAELHNHFSPGTCPEYPLNRASDVARNGHGRETLTLSSVIIYIAKLPNAPRTLRFA
jgi:hypothetical protein